MSRAVMSLVNYCYTLKAKTRNGTGNMKSAIFAVPVNDIRVDSLVEPRLAQSDLGSFLPFIMEGVVSLIGQDNKVPIQILCYTGTFDSFFTSSILPFSSNTFIGSVRPAAWGLRWWLFSYTK